MGDAEEVWDVVVEVEVESGSMISLKGFLSGEEDVMDWLFVSETGISTIVSIPDIVAGAFNVAVTDTVSDD